jgi:hypothetical protein
VRRLVDERDLAGDERHRVYWNARDDEGRIVPDGIYRMRVVRRDEGRVVGSLKDIRVDTKRPRVRLVSASPGVVSPGPLGLVPPVRVRYAGPRNESPEFRVFRTDGGPVRVVARLRGDKTRTFAWNGMVRGHPAADGDYAFSVRVRDRAGNPAQFPSGRTPTPASALPHTGVAVRRLTLRGPLGAVWPLAVAGVPFSRLALGRPRPLVVLPALTWQALNPYDDDLDGFADTLAASGAVRLARPFDRGRLPSRLRSEAEPLLGFLDRERLPYDLTSDLALARGQGPALANAPGVALAGSVRWLTPGLARRLHRYVEDGGRVVSFGARALRSRLTLGADSMRRSGGEAPRDLFGERTARLRTDVAAPLSIERPGLGLFGGVDRFFGAFTLFERSVSLPEDARLAAAAGRDPGEPAFVAYRLGKGIVVRTGTPQWDAELAESRFDSEVQRVTMRLWRLLGRR